MIGENWSLHLKPVPSGLSEKCAVFYCWVLILIAVHSGFLSWLRLSQDLCISSVENVDWFGSAAFHTQLVENEEQDFRLTDLATSLHQWSSIPPMFSWLCCWAPNTGRFSVLMTSNCKPPLPLLLRAVVQMGTIHLQLMIVPVSERYSSTLSTYFIQSVLLPNQAKNCFCTSLMVP